MLTGNDLAALIKATETKMQELETQFNAQMNWLAGRRALLLELSQRIDADASAPASESN
jgi:hypothetical protein